MFTLIVPGTVAVYLPLTIAGQRAPAGGAQRVVALGVLTVIVGWATFFAMAGLVLYAVVVAAMFHAFVTLFQEPRLLAQFAGEYESYCARVPRWLPRLPKRL